MSIINDVVNQKHWRIKESINRNNERNQYPDDLADQVVKYCPQCNRCWERQRTSTNNKSNPEYTYYYSDFPTYGKIKEKCDECKTIRNICDICDTDKPIIKHEYNYQSRAMEPVVVMRKQDGIWVCKECEKKYPKEK